MCIHPRKSLWIEASAKWLNVECGLNHVQSVHPYHAMVYSTLQRNYNLNGPLKSAPQSRIYFSFPLFHSLLSLSFPPSSVYFSITTPLSSVLNLSALCFLCLFCAPSRYQSGVFILTVFSRPVIIYRSRLLRKCSGTEASRVQKVISWD